MLNVAVFATAGSTLAAVRYVDVNSTNAAPPYINWATAATNIQDAVDAAVAGDEIVVTNGIYATGTRDGNRVAVDKPLALHSVNGPPFTTIDGGHSNRCVYLTDGASLSGFTLTNGFAFYGAGVFCQSTNAVVSTCVIVSNVTSIRGYGGGAFRGTLNNCTLSGNTAPAGGGLENSTGGGAYGSTLNNCTLSGNVAHYGDGAAGCTLNNCTLTGNYGVAAFGCILNNCVLSGNRGDGAAYSTLNNCTLTGNLGLGARGGWLNNCTLTGNAGGGATSFVEEGDIYPATLNNCIVYFNDGANYDSYSTLNYSCTTPLPTTGVGNITNEPAFVNPAAGNYRLRPDSPCIDAGTNLSASITNDLDGRPRPLDGNGDGLAAFDMGAYEYRTPFLVWQDSPNPTAPHADWATAAHTIQDAVDAAVAGDEIVVTNGIYATGGRAVDGFTTNRVAVDKPLTVRSVNGPQFTIVDGGQSARCVYLANSASFFGFTLTNGFAYGGFGGGAYGGTLNNCTLSGNRARSDRQGDGGGGGGASDCTLNNCRLTGNVAVSYGGGAFASTLNNCTLNGNSAEAGADRDSAGGGAYSCILNNCTLTGNSADLLSFGGGASGCTLNNCTLSGNQAKYGGGASGGTLNNCIAYFNGAFNTGQNYHSCTLNYSCTTPLPTNGFGNITNAPFVANSPCINAGNNSYVTNATDLDGNPRIVGGTVDIGAYEFQSPASMISYAWLQQFNLPINPATDTADPDGDGVNNYREWLAGSDPTNPFSFPPLLTLIPYGANVILTWPTNAVGFTVQSTTNLVSPAVWTTNSSGPVVIGGQNVVINPISGPQQFYRLRQ